MKLDQIAYYCQTDEQAQYVKKRFGLLHAQWSHDTVTADVTVWRSSGMSPWKGVNVAALQFNEDLGIQLEIIKYIDGLHWCQHHTMYDHDIFIAHIGIHIGNADWPKHLDEVLLVQHALTRHHTAFNDRTYEYRIYRFGPDNYVKYIKRIPR